MQEPREVFRVMEEQEPFVINNVIRALEEQEAYL